MRERYLHLYGTGESLQEKHEIIYTHVGNGVYLRKQLNFWNQMMWELDTPSCHHHPMRKNMTKNICDIYIAVLCGKLGVKKPAPLPIYGTNNNKPHVIVTVAVTNTSA